ncbi:MAG: LLM class flavin-dependent oxidoreductase [Candidatus Bathyarchaeota archaeon]|jgi:alkanesulfonate monooxygenase SsuD/methylene tetrahydromethanopterin reductase-like flavin-dependent oxidoreductase (luciferase family)|nr:LLM class flavin-dependent oxidoreductase [Candidatus Bathyarchaeota archaeon]
MKFGAQVSCYRTSWDHIQIIIEALEKGNWDSLWFADHFLPPPGRREEEPLTAYEAFSLIAAAAGTTKRLRLGHLVLGNTYRNPALVAKMAATVDQISHGRFTLGIGAAWFQREHEAYGWQFPSMRERSDRFEEACALIRALFTSDAPVDFHGHYYQLDQAPLSPGCYQEPHIPILVGGTGERRTLRTLAMYGDIFNLDGWARGPMTLDYYQHKIGIVEQHCENVGRDPAEIKHTILMPVMVTDDDAAAADFIARRRLGLGTVAGPRNYVIHRISEFIDAGVDEIMFGGLPTGDVEQYQRFNDEILTAFQ